MPPLQIRVSRTQTKYVSIRRTPTGRIHAAPTNRPGTTGTWAKQVFAADRHGGVKTPPYKVAEAAIFPANPARRTPLPGGIYASPTNLPGDGRQTAKQAPAAGRARRGSRLKVLLLLFL